MFLKESGQWQGRSTILRGSETEEEPGAGPPADGEEFQEFGVRRRPFYFCQRIVGAPSNQNEGQH